MNTIMGTGLEKVTFRKLTLFWEQVKNYIASSNREAIQNMTEGDVVNALGYIPLKEIPLSQLQFDVNENSELIMSYPPDFVGTVYVDENGYLICEV